MVLVLDASLLLSWYFEDETSPARPIIGRMSTESVVVPSHWFAEVANGVLIGERRSRPTVQGGAQLGELLDVMDITVDRVGADEAIDRILPLARAHRLTVYDALYLELAERLGAALATLDKALIRAGAFVGLTIIDGKS